jgi:hypothetical protein
VAEAAAARERDDGKQGEQRERDESETSAARSGLVERLHGCENLDAGGAIQF